MGFLIRLWPLWILAVILIVWRLWYLHARGEGDPDSTALERKRWKAALSLLIAVAAAALVVTIFETRPQEGAYHPLQMSPDGQLHRATITQEQP